jgi:hypothetical protein
MRRWILALVVGLGMISLGLPAHSAHAAKPHPRLGDTLATWVKDWGKWTPDSNEAMPYWKPCGGLSDAAHIEVGNIEGRITLIGEITCWTGYAPPPPAALFAEAVQFFPRDYKRVGTSKGREGEEDIVFFSASLARLDVSHVVDTDCSGVALKPGLFSYRLDTLRDSGGNAAFRNWNLELGTCA